MRFASPEYFYWLLVVPLVAAGGAVALWRRLHQARQLADQRLFSRLAPEFSGEREIVRLVLLVLAVTALVLALARPQFGTYTRLVKRRGVDVVVALDLSRSMLARDVSARRTGNRLQRAKLEVSGLIDRLRTMLHRLVGALFADAGDDLAPDHNIRRLLRHATADGNKQGSADRDDSASEHRRHPPDEPFAAPRAGRGETTY